MDISAPSAKVWSNNGYRDTSYNFGLGFSGTTSTVSSTIARSYARPLIILKQQNFTRVGTHISTAVAGTATFRLYNWANGKPTTKIKDLGTISMAATGDIEATINETLQAGCYGIVLSKPAVTAGFYYALSNSQILNDFLGEANASGGADLVGRYEDAEACSNPFSANGFLTTAGCPTMYLRKA